MPISINFKLSKLKRLKALLGKGYFPAELPPVFVTNDFAKFAGFIGKHWQESDVYNNHYHKSRYEKFSYPRHGYIRRNLAIVNPVSHFFLCKEISDHWVRIRNYIKTSDISLNIPLIAEGPIRSIMKPDFENIALRKISLQAMHNYTITSDISRFYPTLYTHVIPWALEGKTWCKNISNRIYKKSLGARLDKFVRFGQENQTIGIPIGPDTSRILSEIVMVAIERELPKRFKINSDNLYRNVDDIYGGFSSEAEASDFFSAWVKSLKNYELEVNYEKTNIEQLELPSNSDWAFDLSHFHPPIETKWRDRIRHFFDIAFNFAREHKNSNVLLYAVKSSRSLKVRQQDWPVYEDYIIRAARLNRTVFSSLAEILIEHNFIKFPLNLVKISKLIEDTITTSSIHGHHSEIVWSLFIARALRIQISEDAAKEISKLRSSVCALMALDMRQLNLMPKGLNTRFWESFMDSDGLKSDMWLLSYEADIKGWLPSKNNHVINDHFFKHLKLNNVSFYDQKRNLPKPKNRIKMRIKEYRTRLLFRRLFNNHSI